jgi:hypothetical protein
MKVFAGQGMVKIDRYPAVVQSNTSKWLHIDPEYAVNPPQQPLGIKASQARFGDHPLSKTTVKLIAFNLEKVLIVERRNNIFALNGNFQPFAGLLVHHGIQQRRRKQITPYVYSAGLKGVRVTRSAALPSQVEYQINDAFRCDSVGNFH